MRHCAALSEIDRVLLGLQWPRRPSARTKLRVIIGVGQRDIVCRGEYHGQYSDVRVNIMDRVVHLLTIMAICQEGSMPTNGERSEAPTWNKRRS